MKKQYFPGGLARKRRIGVFALWVISLLGLNACSSRVEYVAQAGSSAQSGTPLESEKFPALVRVPAREVTACWASVAAASWFAEPMPGAVEVYQSRSPSGEPRPPPTLSFDDFSTFSSRERLEEDTPSGSDCGRDGRVGCGKTCLQVGQAASGCEFLQNDITAKNPVFYKEQVFLTFELPGGIDVVAGFNALSGAWVPLACHLSRIENVRVTQGQVHFSSASRRGSNAVFRSDGRDLETLIEVDDWVTGYNVLPSRVEVQTTGGVWRGYLSPTAEPFSIDVEPNVFLAEHAERRIYVNGRQLLAAPVSEPDLTNVLHSDVQDVDGFDEGFIYYSVYVETDEGFGLVTLRSDVVAGGDPELVLGARLRPSAIVDGRLALVGRTQDYNFAVGVVDLRSGDRSVVGTIGTSRGQTLLAFPDVAGLQVLGLFGEMLRLEAVQP